MATVQDKQPRQVSASSRKDWRSWLSKNHALEKEVWLVYYKKHTGKQSVSYRESVEEALCFGWIDGIKKRLDDERYVHRFTPRKAQSKWSPLNITLAEKLIEQGKMSPAGLASFERREIYDSEFLEKRESAEVTLTPELEQALRKNHRAWQNYSNLAPGYRKQYAAWLTSAKRPQTREKRLERAISLLEQNKKLGMK